MAEEERENPSASASASASPWWIRLPVNHISLRKERGSSKTCHFLFYCQELCLNFFNFPKYISLKLMNMYITQLNEQSNIKFKSD